MRKLKKVPFFLDIEFEDFISQEQIKEVAEKVALALKQACDSGSGLAPEDDSTFTKKIRLMCKDVVLLEQSYSLVSPEYKVEDINGVMVQDPIEEKCEDAVELLRNILCESGMECEYDREIHAFLEEHNELPDDYSPYWEEDEEEEEDDDNRININLIICEDDVKKVINSLPNFVKANFTENEIQETIKRFNGETEEDPSASWNLVVEKILYDLFDER